MKKQTQVKDATNKIRKEDVNAVNGVRLCGDWTGDAMKEDLDKEHDTT